MRHSRRLHLTGRVTASVYNKKNNNLSFKCYLPLLRQSACLQMHKCAGVCSAGCLCACEKKTAMKKYNTSQVNYRLAVIVAPFQVVVLYRFKDKEMTILVVEK